MCLLLAVGISRGDYLDAVGGAGGNSVRAADGDVNAWWTSATAPDGLWALRTGYANGGTVCESSGTGSGIEDSPAIVTTISGLMARATYEVHAVYWSSASQNWALRAGFSLGDLVLFDRVGDGATAGTPSGATEGDRIELLAPLGAIQADANGRIRVYVDDKPSNSGDGWYDRTWYDGIQYEWVDTGCISPPLYDFSGPNGEPDCRVDFYDFVELAAAWLECSRIPQSACD